MAITKIYAQLKCADLGVSAVWFTKLFGRTEDVNPMAGLKEWHLNSSAGFQLVEDPSSKGDGNMTLLVDNLNNEKNRLADANLQPSDITVGDFASFLEVTDPDGNTITLASPKS